MAEADIIGRTEEPQTITSLTQQLRQCGLAAGQTVLVHMAMSEIGWVIGGAEAVILAMLEVLGPVGTLMMPSHTSNNSDPADWQNPPVPKSWKPLIRDYTPAFNPLTTPSRMMGVVAELFRTWPGALRSNHPMDSFTALGPNADFLIHGHVLEEGTGESSPIGRLYEIDGYVLLLGVDHSNNSSLHLAEWRATFPGKKRLGTGSAMLVDGQRKWVTFESLDLNDADFGLIGAAFDADHPIRPMYVGLAKARFFKQRVAVDFALEWMEEHRVA